MGEEKTVWPLDDHTPGKHLVLRNYLNAWFPILARYNPRILFVDGFAGPGQYEGGQDGSPIIAIKTLRDHRANGMVSEAVFFFIDADERRCAHLEALLKELESKGEIPKSCKWNVVHGKFDETMKGVLDEADAQKAKLAPSFFMIDPFGVSDPAMSLLERLFKNDRLEVYITFMYEFINRFISRSEFAVLDKLFGTPTWREAIPLGSDERKRVLYELYKSQLLAAGAKYVVRFELRQGNRLKYAIFFATKHPLGADKMKQAIWKVAPGGDYNFRGGYADQLTLAATVDYSPLKTAISAFLQSQPPGEWIAIEDVEHFVIAETDYHSGQYNRPVLMPLEKSGVIEVERPPGSKSGFRKTEPGKPGVRLRWKH